MWFILGEGHKNRVNRRFEAGRRRPNRSVQLCCAWFAPEGHVPGLLTLIGSGEIAPGMTRLHRYLLGRLGGPARAVFLDTPAGFELGVETIHARFRDYVERRLGIPLQVASFRSASAPPESITAELHALPDANYILAGPGSPSYAAAQWRGSRVYEAVVARWQAGAQLVFASSAAIALSRYLLPVYEIYKVGAPLRWLEGLDLLGDYGLNLAIVTHWDNAEGGTHDTRACFMGLERFERLRRLLPAEAVTLGIDEYTACTLDLEADIVEVRGRGGITVLRGDHQQRHLHGETFALNALRAGPMPVAVPPPSLAAPPAATTQTPDPLALASERIADGEWSAGLRAAAEAAPPSLAIVLHQAADAMDAQPPSNEAALLALLMEIRTGLRTAQQWVLADQLRDRLLTLGYELRDTPQGTMWEKKGPAA